MLVRQTYIKNETAPNFVKQMSTKAKRIPLVKQSSTADRVATLLRERILSMEEEAYLGSEANLAAEVGVSLPTLRQAARMLEYEELLTIKPGKGGGYFACRPTIETAINSASQFLSSSDLGSSGGMFMDVAEPVVNQILLAAIKSKDKLLINELRLFVKSQRANTTSSHLTNEHSFKVSADLMVLFAQMSGNILLELFVRILWNEISLSRVSGTFQDREELNLANYTSRLLLAEAVLTKDKDKVVRAWKKRAKLMRAWPQTATTPAKIAK